VARHSEDYSALLGFEVRPGARVELEALPQVREALSRITTPAGPQFVTIEATRCLTATTSRPRDAADVRGLIAIFAAELADYPADVVATAFRSWARRERYWPALAEIVEACDRENRWRASLARALDDLERIARTPAIEEKPRVPWSELPAEERERFLAMMAEARAAMAAGPIDAPIGRSSSSSPARRNPLESIGGASALSSSAIGFGQVSGGVLS
jgi:hypothetical protein